MEKKKKIYFENLDAIRFLCFLSVFLFHSFHTESELVKNSDIYHFIQTSLLSNGNLGVNFFFVLSGFLITYLLIEEKKLNGNINIRKFWIRRVLRIWPLFYCCVFFGFYIFPLLKTSLGQEPNETANILYYLTFLNNFDFINNGLPDSSSLGVLWSIAIEEQFYVIWPIVLYIFPIKRYWIVFVGILAISISSRAINSNYLFHEYHTLSCIGDMIIGALGAWLILENDLFKNKLIQLNKSSIALIYAGFFVCYFFREELFFHSTLIRTLERPLIAIVILFIILEQSFSINSFFKFSKLRLITRLGRISYGLYSLHFIGILITINLFKFYDFTNELIQVLLFETTTALIITIIISYFSYRFLEKPFLRIKDKFSYFSKN